jgi:carboxylesterase
MADDFSYTHKDSKSAVLLLHGMTGHPRELHKFGVGLHEAGYDVYAPVIPGHCLGMNELRKVDWRVWVKSSLSEYDKLKEKYEHVFVSGICLGAILSIIIAEERDTVAGVSALSTTLYLDGWALPWTTIFLPIGLNTLVRYFYMFPESGPFGIKNDESREKIKNKLKTDKTLLSFFPLSCVHEMLLSGKYAKKNIKKCTAPIIIIHSRRDDMTSLRSADFVFKNCLSKIKEQVTLENSYHMITLDNEQDLILAKTIDFFEKLQ